LSLLISRRFSEFLSESFSDRCSAIGRVPQRIRPEVSDNALLREEWFRGGSSLLPESDAGGRVPCNHLGHSLLICVKR
jgi:hypothetical protein